MATATKRQLALFETLYKELDRLARSEGKSAAVILRDLIAGKRKKLLKQEYQTVQGYGSKKAKASSEHMTSKIQIDSDALLARARAVRRTPKGIRVTDRLLRLLRGKLKGMPKDNVREKQKEEIF